MVPITSLVVPILLSAVLVFVASSVIHMVLGYHAGDVQKLPREDDVLEALRPFELQPGDYAAPRPSSMAAMQQPEFIEKMTRGPVFVMTVRPRGPAGMGGALVQWFVYSVVIGVFVAYVTGRVFGPGASYTEVFRLAGITAFLSYALALPQYSIWYGRRWRTTFVSMFDGLVYGLLTAGTFGWLWPR